MELKGTPEDIVNSLITELLGIVVDNDLPMVEIQSAMNNAGIIASIEEITEFTDTIRLVNAFKQHRRTCPDCTERDDIEHSEQVHR